MFQAINTKAFLLTIASAALLGSITIGSVQAHSYDSASLTVIDNSANTINAGDVCKGAKDDGKPKDDGTRCE